MFSTHVERLMVLSVLLVLPAPARIYAQIYYAGGNVISVPVNAYVIYYGGWGPLARSVIDNWLSSIGGTGLYGINARYRDYTGASVQNRVNYNSSTSSYNDNYSRGKILYDTPSRRDIEAIIGNAIGAGSIPADSTNGVYFVLTAKDVTVLTPFGQTCSNILGYHNSSSIIYGTNVFRYVVVENAAACPAIYDGNILHGDPTTPNGTIAGDGTINIMFHELSETVTDPDRSISIGTWGALPGGQKPVEVADLCEWFFGDWDNLPTTSSGAHYNTTIAGVNYLIQRLYRIPAVMPQLGSYYYGECDTGNEPIVSITSSTNPTVTGQPITYTATVTASDGGTPTGTITFVKSNQLTTSTIGTVPLIGGQASITWTFGLAGAKFITAVYSGDINYESSPSPALQQNVNWN